MLQNSYMCHQPGLLPSWGVRVPSYSGHPRAHEVDETKRCPTMSAAKTSPDAPSPSDAPMPKASTVICLIASRGGGARAQQALPARDTQARDSHCASSSGTCQGPHTAFEPFLFTLPDLGIFARAWASIATPCPSLSRALAHAGKFLLRKGTFSRQLHATRRSSSFDKQPMLAGKV